MMVCIDQARQDNAAGRIDQLGPLRPFAGAGRYATEIPGLYLCGSCCAPGGGVTAGPGYNAFKVLCEDFGYSEVWRTDSRTY